MKIAFFSPYLPKHTGGGEKYLLDCAQIAAESGHQVFIAVSSDKQLSLEETQAIKDKYQQFLDSSLTQIEFVSSPLFTPASFLKKLIWTNQFDCLYYQTDGSLFFSLAKKNILHIQVPFPIKKSSILDRLKLNNWKIKNTNSDFTKEKIEEYWGTKIDYVHQPFVEIPPLEKKPSKDRVILSVGRFFRQLHSKRQDILVDFFKELVGLEPKLMKEWQLVLIGKKEDEEYAKQIADKASGFNITLIHDADRVKLIDYYYRSSIYWHATGYDINEDIEPQKVEHFGISTLEAMAAEAVPVVINKGGQKEILGKEFAECLWDNKNECLAKTIDLIKNKSKQIELASKVKIRSEKFSKENFTKILLEMLEK